MQSVQTQCVPRNLPFNWAVYLAMTPPWSGALHEQLVALLLLGMPGTDSKIQVPWFMSYEYASAGIKKEPG
jgi:hypothetical protein